jgi:hypothetical protein
MKIDQTHMKIDQTHIKFLSSAGEPDIFVNLADIIHGGIPIDEDGEELEQADNEMYSFDGKNYSQI